MTLDDLSPHNASFIQIQWRVSYRHS